MPELGKAPQAFPLEQFRLITFCDASGHAAPSTAQGIPRGRQPKNCRIGCGAQPAGGRTFSIQIVYTGRADTGIAEFVRAHA
jgi:hypothetical protein